MCGPQRPLCGFTRLELEDFGSSLSPNRRAVRLETLDGATGVHLTRTRGRDLSACIDPDPDDGIRIEILLPSALPQGQRQKPRDEALR
jgi:hypothetical protein